MERLQQWFCHGGVGVSSHCSPSVLTLVGGQAGISSHSPRLKPSPSTQGCDPTNPSASYGTGGGKAKRWNRQDPNEECLILKGLGILLRPRWSSGGSTQPVVVWVFFFANFCSFSLESFFFNGAFS